MSPGHETCHHRLYFLTCDDFETLLARSAGRCERCSIFAKFVRRGKFCIDHDDHVGWYAVRGLICPKCNSRLAQVDAGAAVDALTQLYLEKSWFLHHDSRYHAYRARFDVLCAAKLAGTKPPKLPKRPPEKTDEGDAT